MTGPLMMSVEPEAPAATCDGRGLAEPMKYEKGAIVRQYHNSTRLRYDDARIKYVHKNGALDVIGLDGTPYGWSVNTCEVV